MNDQRDLKSLCEISKTLNSCATAFLYNTVILVAEETHYGFSNVRPFLEGSESRLHYIKHLHIVTPPKC